MSPTDRREILQQLTVLNEELLTTQAPKLRPSSLEDWDDRAQELLEYKWWKEEQQEKIKELITILYNSL